MRTSVGSVADFANVTWQANANATLPLTLLSVSSLFTGLPANLFVLYISFSSSLVVGDYKYFLANLFICNSCLCLSLLFQLCIHLFYLLTNTPLNVTRCYIQTFSPYMFGFCAAAALPLTSINRYFVICRESKVWTKKRIILICATAYFPMIYPVIDFLFASKVAYYSDLCLYNLFVPFNPEWVVYILALYTYPSLIFCNQRVYQRLSAHMKKTIRLLSDQNMNNDNERSILKALVLQATIPPICIMPAVILLLLVQFVGFDQDKILQHVVIRIGENIVLTTFDLCLLFYNFNQLFDALITIIVVKPYWRTTQFIFSNLKRKLIGGENSLVKSTSVSTS